MSVTAEENAHGKAASSYWSTSDRPHCFRGIRIHSPRRLGGGARTCIDHARLSRGDAVAGGNAGTPSSPRFCCRRGSVWWSE